MPKISIILPVYNAEQFLEKCLGSIFVQTFQDFELIAINDGSTDKSYEILKSFEINYPDTMRLFSHKNEGASVTRNKGIEFAKGDFLCFIDSDDYIEADYLDVLYSQIDDSDFIISGYRKVNIKGKVLFEKYPKNCEWSAFKYSTNWGKLYQSTLFKDNGIKYENFRIGEDLLITVQAIIHSKKIKIVPYAGYNYVTNEDSLTNTIKEKQQVNEITPLLEAIHKKVISSMYDKEKVIYYFYLKTIVFNLYMQRKELDIVELKGEFSSGMDFVKRVLNQGKVLFSWQHGEDLSVNLLVNICVFSFKIKQSNLFLKLMKVI